jgi:hypothetical protein
MRHLRFFFIFASILCFVGVNLTFKASGQTTHYISKTLGADTNNGTSESSPWAHLPGMQTCTGNCAAYTPGAGDTFVLYGGDTWSASDLGVNWTNVSGSSSSCVLPYGSGATSSCIHVGGLDSSWYSSSVCGGSYCRPIFNCGGADCASGGSTMYYDFWGYNVSYVVIDNIEFTGFYDDQSMGGYVALNATNSEVRNSYFHGWSHSSGATAATTSIFTCSSGNPTSCSGTLFDYNAVDGSDSSKDMMYGQYGGGWDTIAFNYFGYLGGAVVGQNNVVHDNVVEYPVLNFDGSHANSIFNFQPNTGNYIVMYNNVIRHTTGCSGCVNMWMDGNGSANPAVVGYYFNNVEYDLTASNILNIGNHGSGNYGTYYVFGNTTECGSDSDTAGCGGVPPTGPYYTIYDQDNYYISSSGAQTGGTARVCGPGYTCNANNDLTQTISVANALGLNDTLESFVFSPPSSCTIATCLTIQAGVNYQNYCSTIGALNIFGASAAAAACQSDSTYGVSYNTANHTVSSPDRTAISRPVSAAWDIGAFQFSTSSQTKSPASPTGLTATPVAQ